MVHFKLRNGVIYSCEIHVEKAAEIPMCFGHVLYDGFNKLFSDEAAIRGLKSLIETKDDGTLES